MRTVSLYDINVQSCWVADFFYAIRGTHGHKICRKEKKFRGSIMREEQMVDKFFQKVVASIIQRKGAKFRFRE